MTQPRDVPKKLREIAKLIRSTGVPATINPERVQIPGVWVAIGNEIELTLDGVSISCDIHLIARDTGASYALENIMDMLQKILDHPDLAAPLSIQTDLILLARYQVELPTMILKYEVE